MIDKKLLAILRCPITNAPLELSDDHNELICYGSGLAYPIKNDIPVMLEAEARELTTDEKLDRK
jgi:uncharacterized protein YbaR (Trm112 family)